MQTSVPWFDSARPTETMKKPQEYLLWLSKETLTRETQRGIFVLKRLNLILT